MNEKTKLKHDSTYILEGDDDEEHIVFSKIEAKGKRKSETPKVESLNSSEIDPPVRTGRRYEHPKAPEIREDNTPTLHSDI